MANPKVRLAVFFDGTDNTPKDRTNVWRTHELLADRDAQNVPQLKFYIKGVGTNQGQILAGSIFGAGIEQKIREGYEWLVNNYCDGAEVYVFGFSRGAFAARSFVQLIACCGLPTPACLAEWSIGDAFRRYDQITRQDQELVHPIYRLRFWRENPTQAPAGWMPDATEQRLLDDTRVRVIKIQMAGLWDTVGALGKDALKDHAASTQKSASHNVRPTRTQLYGYHAIAIDEHRPMFDVTLWRTFAPQGEEAATLLRYSPYYEQRWFIGAHSDVGGGYGDDELPDLSMAWIVGKAQVLGLAFTHRLVPRPGAWRAPIHDSFESFAGGVLSLWDKIMPGDQRHYREMGKAPKTETAADGTAGSLCSINETIDASVLSRWSEDPTYRPPGLVSYMRQNPAQLPAGTSLAQQTQRIYASKYWNATGVFLRADTRYRVRVVPDIGEPLRDAEFVTRGIEGEDWNDLKHKSASLMHGKRKDDARWFALIGTVDKERPWIIKPDADFTVPVSGQLLCYFNDVQAEWFYNNNSGWVILEIIET